MNGFVWVGHEHLGQIVELQHKHTQKKKSRSTKSSIIQFPRTPQLYLLFFFLFHCISCMPWINHVSLFYCKWLVSNNGVHLLSIKNPTPTLVNWHNPSPLPTSIIGPSGPHTKRGMLLKRKTMSFNTIPYLLVMWKYHNHKYLDQNLDSWHRIMIHVEKILLFIKNNNHFQNLK